MCRAPAGRTPRWRSERSRSVDWIDDYHHILKLHDENCHFPPSWSSRIHASTFLHKATILKHVPCSGSSAGAARRISLTRSAIARIPAIVSSTDLPFTELVQVAFEHHMEKVVYL